MSQTDSVYSDRFLTDIVWLWGQFVDHDIDLSGHAEPKEPFNIEVPRGDSSFDPFGSGTVTMGLNRSDYALDESGVRQQINSISSYIDGSMVYGSDTQRAAALRTFEGGRLRVSEGDLLPMSDQDLDNAGPPGGYLAGDVRANENVALTAMHTLWVREHNRLASEIFASDSSLSDEEIYQQARNMVVAEIQSITYNEFLPALLGFGAISDYSGYDSTVNASIANEFSTAGYRFGHSMVSKDLLRLDETGAMIPNGDLSLAEAFFSPHEIMENGIDSLLRGATSQTAQEIDLLVVDELRNFLFGAPGMGGLDLASLNVQRGRDHGLADYNTVRFDMGLDTITSFSEISSDREIQAILESLYGSVDDIDLWVGVLAEDHVDCSSVGELGRAIITDQFTRLRAGDRFWYENMLSGRTLDEINDTTLSAVIMRNTEITGLRSNVFYSNEVLFFTMPEAGTSNDVTLTYSSGDISLTESNSNSVLFSEPASTIQSVVIVGSTGSDRVTFKLAGLPGMRLKNAEIHLQDGEADTLRIVGTRSFDDVLVTKSGVIANGVHITTTGSEVVRVDGGQGNDRLRSMSHPRERIQFFGGMGNDILRGSNGHDLLIGGVGDDRLVGKSGNDEIRSGSGNDLLYGNDGTDSLDGGRGNDRIFGGGDDDTLHGSVGYDLVIGGSGIDLVVDPEPDDTMRAVERITYFNQIQLIILDSLLEQL